jgi:trimeric autotransporter adhesin
VRGSTIGNNLTITAGGGILGGTDETGGNLILSSGISTGTGSSNILFQTYPAASSTSSSDNAAITALTLSATSVINSNPITLLQAATGIGTNQYGGNLTISSGVSTGNAISGINFNVYGAGASGSTPNNSTTALTISSNGQVDVTQGNLLVAGSSYLYFSNSTAQNRIVFNNPGPTNYMTIDEHGTGSNSYIDLGYSSSITGTIGTEVLTVGDNGRVGIGTSTIANALDVNGAASIGYINTAAPTNGLIVNGNVGIGTTVAHESLEEHGNMRIGQAPNTGMTTLNGALTSSATTMTVVSTAGYPTTGTLYVDQEAITYTGVTSTTFTGLTRGSMGTTAASHLTGASVNNFLLSIMYSSSATFFPGYVFMGDGSIANGSNGSSTKIGTSSTAFGASTASGVLSTATGSSATASGKYSTAMGQSTTASGQNSTAMGQFTTAASFLDVAIGHFNVGNTTTIGTNTWVAADPVFEIGIGTSTNVNAMTVLKSGFVGIGTTAPLAPLDIQSTLTSNGTIYGQNLNLTYNSGTSTLVQGQVVNIAATSLGTGGVMYGAKYSAINTSSTAGSTEGASFTAQGNSNASENVYGVSASGSGSGGHVYGVYSSANATGSTVSYLASFYGNPVATGATTNAYVLDASLSALLSGAITNAYGVKLEAPTATLGGTISNYYGLYIATPSAATTNYALYSQGGTTYFGGNVGIGTTAPQATLDVNGYARLALNSSQPVACSGTNQGAVALNHLAQMCACNGSSWIFADSVGGTCSW